MSMKFYRKLPIPQDVKAEYPLTGAMAEQKKKRDAEIRAVFEGQSDKFLLIIGPCSADKVSSVCEYLSRLARVYERVSDKIIIIPRVYTNKPRTTGAGYKGMLHQPDPSGHPDMLRGLVETRHLHMTALRDYGFSCADELLYPAEYRYISDLVSYISVGARSVENQEHRLVASGLDIPVGMKNPTSGEFSVMMNAVFAAQHSHTFLYRGWEVKSTGNPMTHAVLRGYVTMHGRVISNYHYEDLESLYGLYADMQLSCPAVVVDCNHANSDKHYAEQPRIAMDVLSSMRASGDIRRFCKGLMIESYLVDGCQSVDGDVFGQSITDPCLGWDKTERLIYEIAENL